MWNMLKAGVGSMEGFWQESRQLSGSGIADSFLRDSDAFPSDWRRDGLAIPCASKKLPDAWLDHPDEAYDMNWAHKQ